MTPTTWVEVANYTLLALGGAMFAGTGTALLSYRRNGVFPGQPVDEDGTPTDAPALRSAYVKLVLGLVVGLWGIAGLVSGTIVGF